MNFQFWLSGGCGVWGLIVRLRGFQSSVVRWGLEANGPRQRGNTGGVGETYSDMCEAVIDDLLQSLKRCCGFVLTVKIREYWFLRGAGFICSKRERYLGMKEVM